MKNYFKFKLEGKQFLPVWLLGYFLVIVPYIAMFILNNRAVANHEKPYALLIFIPILFITGPALYFYITKMTIENVALSNETLQTKLSFGKFFGIYTGGLLLSIITLGIYSPWFIKKMQDFFTNNTSYKSREFTFLGEGGKLWLIITLSLILPIILVAVLFHSYLVPGIEQTFVERCVRQAITTFLMIPYIYYVYKWMVNIKFNNYHIQWDTELMPSLGKVALEVTLSIITFGLYYPMALLKLYHYFIHKTKSNVVDNQQIQFGYDLAPKEDYLYLLGQGLLTLITLGFYYPWAFANIGKRILDKTYMEKVAVE